MSLTIAHLQSLVAQVRPFFPNAELCVAGGAVRDIILGRPVKDIDLFIGTEEILTKPALHKHKIRAEELRHALGVNLCTQADYASGHRPIPLQSAEAVGYTFAGFSVLNISPGFRGYPLQLIFREACFGNLREAVMETFDLGICQAWVDERGVRSTPAFQRDVANRTLTRVSDDWDLTEESFDEHLARIQAKYPGWRVRDARPKQDRTIPAQFVRQAFVENDLRPFPAPSDSVFLRDLRA